jgi:hypothetical protein
LFDVFAGEQELWVLRAAGVPRNRGTSHDLRNAARDSREDYLPVQYVRIIWKIVEVAFNLFKVIGGNWSAVAALVLSLVELHAVWQVERGAAQAF